MAMPLNIGGIVLRAADSRIPNLMAVGHIALGIPLSMTVVGGL